MSPFKVYRYIRKPLESFGIVRVGLFRPITSGCWLISLTEPQHDVPQNAAVPIEAPAYSATQSLHFVELTYELEHALSRPLSSLDGSLVVLGITPRKYRKVQQLWSAPPASLPMQYRQIQQLGCSRRSQGSRLEALQELRPVRSCKNSTLQKLGCC